jgi:hypothetical protein
MILRQDYSGGITMNILDRLNEEYQIEVKDNIAYDMQEKSIIARSKQELIQFYIDSFKYKAECLFEDEVETRNNYENIIKQLENLIQ